MPKRERFKLSLSVFLLLVKDDNVLLIKRSNTGWMDGYYSVPAGALDEHESLEEAVMGSGLASDHGDRCTRFSPRSKSLAK